MTKEPKDILAHYWGFTSFKDSQKKVIDAVLDGQDVLALLPTGGGKSLCYQIPALAKEGICIVVSPLIALIQDQVNNLKQKGIKAIGLTGGISQTETIALLDNCLYGNYKFLYVSPERLQQEIVLDKIKQMNVNLLAIDEAHCISQWGNDFRPAYLNCAVLKELCLEIPMIALTATATTKVAEDIRENLNFTNPTTIKTSFSRNNISFNVLFGEDKQFKLKQLIYDTRNSIIIYVSSRRIAESTSNYLISKNYNSTHFHGGMTKIEKEKTLHNWLENKTQIIVATNAFGMGIDKPDVALVVHYQIPDSIENYFQEAGRAGRNGATAKAIIITNKNDEKQAEKQFISVIPDATFIKLLYKKLNNYFQIAYGEGTEETHQFKFNHFCDTYKLKPMLTYNGLRLLDQNSIIALSEIYSKKTSIQFIAPKNQLFHYLEINKKIAPIIQTILRTYGGVYDYETKINTLLVSKKASVNESIVLKTLEQLHKDKIISYQNNQGDIEITFIAPREDDRTINRFADKISTQKQNKINNLKSILDYINNDTICRSIQLLTYFGENEKKKCGHCDVCLSNNQPNQSILNIVAQDILDILDTKNSSSRKLIQELGYKEHIVLTSIQKLLESEKIIINSKNEYQLIKNG